MFDTEEDVADYLAGCLKTVLDAGWSVSGLDITRVRITRDGADPVKEVYIPPSPPGFNGDISTCCGAPAEQKGTCLYCTACGESNGCS